LREEVVGPAGQPRPLGPFPIELEALVPEITALGGLDVGKRDIAAGKSRPIYVALVIGDIDANHIVPERRELELVMVGEDGSERPADCQGGQAQQQPPTDRNMRLLF
jgi:hypothetical protein